MAIVCAQVTRFDMGDGTAQMNVHIAFMQCFSKCLPHPVIVGWQEFAGLIKQMKGELVGILAPGPVFVAQAMLHGQGQLHATGTGTDHANGQRAFMGFGPLKQGQPALIETIDGFDRHGMVAGAGYIIYLRCGSDVNG